VSVLRAIRSEPDAAVSLSTQGSGAKEEKKAMARRKLTFKDQLKGIHAALKSKRTPPQLRQGLRNRAAWLRKRIG
jgi:hypothetical protein